MLMRQEAFSEAENAEFETIRKRCLGCEGCTGVCLALFELISVPDEILKNAKTVYDSPN